MRRVLALGVVLGLVWVTLPASANRLYRERHDRDRPGRFEKLDPGVERARPTGDVEGMSASRAQQVVREAADSRAPGIGMGKLNNARGQFLLGRGAAQARTAFNEAGEAQGMPKAAAQIAIAKAAATRAPGLGTDKVNNARGQFLLGRAAASGRTSFNEAGEAQGMSTSAAKMVVAKMAKTRAPGNGYDRDKLNNARGKEMLGKAAPSARMMCNEAGECSMGNSGAKAEWQKEAMKRSHAR